MKRKMDSDEHDARTESTQAEQAEQSRTKPNKAEQAQEGRVFEPSQVEEIAATSTATAAFLSADCPSRNEEERREEPEGHARLS